MLIALLNKKIGQYTKIDGFACERYKADGVEIRPRYQSWKANLFEFGQLEHYQFLKIIVKLLLFVTFIVNS